MDTRGQPVQVGVIILFGFLVVAFATFQAVIVPQQNAEVEFTHNQDVQSQLTELRGALLRAAATGEAYPVSVQLGTTYPPRVFAVNPNPGSGTLRTVEFDGGSDLGVTNAEAVDDEVGDYWDGSTREYTTGGLTYVPSYNVFQRAPSTRYENSVLYNRDPDETVALLSGQRLVDGRQLDLTVLQGTYQASRSGAVSVDISSPTPPPRTILVHGAPDPIEVSFPTALSQSVWERLLEDERAANGGHVADVSKSGGILTLTLEETDAAGNSIEYRLTVSAAAVGSDIPATSTAYVTAVSGDGATIPEGGKQQVVAEVRNEFNGPESGVETCAAVTRGPGSIEGTPTTDASGADGRVDYTYDAPNDVTATREAVVTVGFDCDSGDPKPSAPPETKATFVIDVYDTGGGGGGGGGGGSNPPSASIDDVTDESQCSDTTGGGGCTGSAATNVAEFDVTWSASDDVEITDVTVELLDKNGNVVDRANPPASGTSASGTVTLSENGGYGGDYTIRLIVTDSDGQTATDSVSDTADGTNP